MNAYELHSWDVANINILLIGKWDREIKVEYAY